jgi:glycosyltransferase involved in cell wall biosynthesis
MNANHFGSDLGLANIEMNLPVLDTVKPPGAIAHAPAVIVAHSGKQHAYRHAVAVNQAGALLRFVTSAYYKPDGYPDCLMRWSGRLDAWLRRRTLEALPSAKVVRRWRFELPELLARTFVGNGSLADRLVMRRDARFDRWVARHWAGAGDIFWGFQGSCLESLKAARQAGKLAVAEFATAHVTSAIAILQREAERHPEWAATISNFHYPDWYRERLEQEPSAADYCVVASTFSRQSLERVGVPESKIKLLPLGVELQDFAFVPRNSSGPFRVLFVGGIGQRKGIKYLLEAFKRVRTPGMELVLIGPIGQSAKPLAEYGTLFRYLGRLDQCEVVRQMHQAHVLVLPSVFEGFGLVIPEAMATGMPVIASTHSIGPELIREGRDGFVIAPDDVDGLASKLDWLASNRADACQMGQEAAEHAKSLSWEVHASRLREILAEIWR